MKIVNNPTIVLTEDDCKCLFTTYDMLTDVKCSLDGRRSNYVIQYPSDDCFGETGIEFMDDLVEICTAVRDQIKNEHIKMYPLREIDEEDD